METIERLFNGSNFSYTTLEECVSFSKRCHIFLGCPVNVNEYDCDAIYYDYCVLPDKIRDKMSRDAYLVFGIT